jgi:hypothetical protein
MAWFLLQAVLTRYLKTFRGSCIPPHRQQGMCILSLRCGVKMELLAYSGLILRRHNHRNNGCHVASAPYKYLPALALNLSHRKFCHEGERVHFMVLG